MHPDDAAPRRHPTATARRCPSPSATMWGSRSRRNDIFGKLMSHPGRVSCGATYELALVPRVMPKISGAEAGEIEGGAQPARRQGRVRWRRRSWRASTTHVGGRSRRAETFDAALPPWRGARRDAGGQRCAAPADGTGRWRRCSSSPIWCRERLRGRTRVDRAGRCDASTASACTDRALRACPGENVYVVQVGKRKVARITLA